MSTQIAVTYQVRVIQVAPLRAIYEQPIDSFAAAFVGQANFIGRPCTAYSAPGMNDDCEN